MTKQVFISGPARTPIGMFHGAFSDISAPQLGSFAAKAALERARLRPEQIDEAYFGNVVGAGLGQNVARQVVLGAGLPHSCGAVTVNKVCGSGMRAVIIAAQSIQSGDADVVLAGGCENMTRAPYLLSKAREGYKMGHGELTDAMIRDGLSDAYSNQHMGLCGEACARETGITREEQDNFAIASYKRLLAAHKAGQLHGLVPVEYKTKAGPSMLDHDEEPARFNEEKLRQLRPAFDAKGTITAGNASKISDGAAAMIVLSEEKAKTLGVPKAARILGYANAALAPERFPFAPTMAIRKLCDKLSMSIDKVDLFEINEAFSVVTLTSMKELNLPHEKVNVFGGAVAMGHPIGASGARIIVTLLDALRARGSKVGIACACIGGGEATAIAIETAT